MGKIKFLFFLFVLGIFLYYFGKPNPMKSLKGDFSRILGNSSQHDAEPWTREGRGDSVATDEGSSIATDIENKIKLKKPSMKKSKRRKSRYLIFSKVNLLIMRKILNHHLI
jgi:hypothetical protein